MYTPSSAPWPEDPCHPRDVDSVVEGSLCLCLDGLRPEGFFFFVFVVVVFAFDVTPVEEVAMPEEGSGGGNLQ